METKLKKGRLATAEKYEYNGYKINNHTVTSGVANTFVFGVSFIAGTMTSKEVIKRLEELKMRFEQVCVEDIPDMISKNLNIWIEDVPKNHTPKAFCRCEYYINVHTPLHFYQMNDKMREIIKRVL